MISITGCGGKTTLMRKLSQELRAYKTLITTTTKIQMPSPDQYDYFYLGNEDIRAKNGITLAANSKTTDGKLAGYAPQILNELVKSFDYAIIESDGAKMKQLKGWNDTEPVIIGRTTKTIGIINLKLLGADINPTNIHRMELYVKHFCSGSDKIVNMAQIQSLIASPQGLFKHALGEKILFLNQVESREDWYTVEGLWGQWLEDGAQIPDKIICGSLLKEEYKVEEKRK